MNIKKKQRLTDESKFEEMCRVRGSEEARPGLHWKSLLCNLNIVTVGLASPPTVLPRWNSLRRVFNALSAGELWAWCWWMGADFCLLLRVPAATQHRRPGSWCMTGLFFPMSQRKGSISSSSCPFLSLLYLTAAFLRKSSEGIFWRNHTHSYTP